MKEEEEMEVSLFTVLAASEAAAGLVHVLTKATNAKRSCSHLKF